MRGGGEEAAFWSSILSSLTTPLWAWIGHSSLARARGERVADDSPPVEGLAVVQRFRLQGPVSRPPCGDDNQRVVPGKPVPLRAVEAQIVRFQGEPCDGADRARRFQPLADFGVRPVELARGHRSALVEDLDTDRAAQSQRRLGAIRWGARGQALKTGESSFQEIALMLEFLEVRFNLIGVQPAQPFLRPQPAQPFLRPQPAQPFLRR